MGNISKTPATTMLSTGAHSPSTFNVISAIATRELVEQLTSFRFQVILLLVVFATPLAVYVGVRDYNSRTETSSRLTREQQALVASPDGKTVDLTISPWKQESGNLLVLRTIRPTEPLSVFVHGLDGMLPQYWDYTAVGAVPGPSAWQAQRLADALGRLDLEFLVRVVLGLLAILMAFDAVVGEKEIGTLRMVLSQSVPRAAVLTGKLVGGVVTLVIPLICCFLLAILTSRFLGIDLVSGNAGKLALLGLTSIIYLICFYSFGLFISSLTRTQKTSLVTLLVAWVLAVLAVPPLATMIARAVYPDPAAVTLQNRKTAIEDDIRRESTRAMTAELLGVTVDGQSTRGYNERKDEMNRRFSTILLESLDKRRRLLNDLDRESQRVASLQTRLARVLMLLSPAAAFANAAADIAGTGDSQHASWSEAVGHHQVQLNVALFDDPPSLWVVTFDSAGRPMTSISVVRHKPPSIDALPGFSPPPRDVRAAIGSCLASQAQLLIATGMLIMGGFVAFSKYDVR